MVHMSFDMRETAPPKFLLSRDGVLPLPAPPHDPSGVCGMKKRQDSSTEISIAFAMVALVAAILIVYFDTAHKLKLLDERIENIEMSGPQTK